MKELGTDMEVAPEVPEQPKEQWPAIRMVARAAIWVLATAAETMRPVNSANYPDNNHRPH